MEPHVPLFMAIICVALKALSATSHNAATWKTILGRSYHKCSFMMNKPSSLLPYIRNRLYTADSLFFFLSTNPWAQVKTNTAQCCIMSKAKVHLLDYKSLIWPHNCAGWRVPSQLRPRLFVLKELYTKSLWNQMQYAITVLPVAMTKWLAINTKWLLIIQQ